MQVSATLRPIGPSTEIGVQPMARRSTATMPGEGRKPTTPQNEAGLRKLPPGAEGSPRTRQEGGGSRKLPRVWEPGQPGGMWGASPTAEPPDEPPGLSIG